MSATDRVALEFELEQAWVAIQWFQLIHESYQVIRQAEHHQDIEASQIHQLLATDSASAILLPVVVQIQHEQAWELRQTRQFDEVAAIQCQLRQPVVLSKLAGQRTRQFNQLHWSYN